MHICAKIFFHLVLINLGVRLVKAHFDDPWKHTRKEINIKFLWIIFSVSDHVKAFLIYILLRDGKMVSPLVYIVFVFLIVDAKTPT